MTPSFVTAADVFGTWLADVERGDPPARYALAEPFARLDLRPGRLVMLAGAPGSGKTAAILQMAVDLLRLNEGAKLLLANVEMPPGSLVERIASRLSGVPLTAIADRTLTADQRGRVLAAVAAMEPIAGRLAFLAAPFSLEHLAAAGTAFEANVIAADYLQRFAVGDGSKAQREALEAGAAILRRFCDAGACVVVASAVARQKGKSGSSYGGLNLASLRGSSELEFGSDAVYLVVPDDADGVRFECAKNRYGAPVDLQTTFDASVQTFRAAPSGLAGFDAVTPARGKADKAKGG